MKLWYKFCLFALFCIILSFGSAYMVLGLNVNGYNKEQLLHLYDDPQYDAKVLDDAIFTDEECSYQKPNEGWKKIKDKDKGNKEKYYIKNEEKGYVIHCGNNSDLFLYGNKTLVNVTHKDVSTIFDLVIENGNTTVDSLYDVVIYLDGQNEKWNYTNIGHTWQASDEIVLTVNSTNPIHHKDNELFVVTNGEDIHYNITVMEETCWNNGTSCLQLDTITYPYINDSNISKNYVKVFFSATNGWTGFTNNTIIDPFTFNESTSQSTTTGTTYLTKATHEFEVLIPTFYTVLGNAYLHEDSTVGQHYVVRMQQDATTVAASNSVSEDPDITEDYQAWGAHETDIYSAGNYTTTIQYASGVLLTSAYIRDARLFSVEAREHYTVRQAAEESLPASLTSIESLFVTPSQTTSYLTIASGEFTPNSDALSSTVQLHYDDVEIDEQVYESSTPVVIFDYRDFFFHNITTLDAGTYEFEIKGLSESAAGDIRRSEITAIALDGLYEWYSNESTGDSTTTSESYQDKVSLTFTPTQASEAIFLATAQATIDNAAGQFAIELDIDGVQMCEYLHEPKEITSPTDYLGFVCLTNKTLNTSSHTATIRYRAEASGGATVTIRNAKLSAIVDIEGVLNGTLLSDPVPFEVYENNVHNFTANVSCIEGECGNVIAELVKENETINNFNSATEYWTHEQIDAENDQWHKSTESTHEGSHSWKVGSTGAGNYASNSNSGLISPSFPIKGNVTVEFYQYMVTEAGFDAGKLEYRLDDGLWQKVENEYFTDGGYNDLFELGTSAPVNFTEDEDVWSGTIGSSGSFDKVAFTLYNIKNTNISFRFRFGTDDNTVNEGWYVDNFSISGMHPLNTSIPGIHTVSSNPATSSEFSCLADMGPNDSCEVSWLINATDTVGTTQDLHVFFSPENQALPFQTANTTMTITEAPITYSAPLAITYEIEEFNYSSDAFVEAVREEITLIHNTSVVLLSVFDIEKIGGGGGATTISVQYRLDDVIIHEQDVRTITGLNDIGAVVVAPVVTPMTEGLHNISVYFGKDTASGTYSVTNFYGSIIDEKTADNSTIRHDVVNDIFTQNSLTYTNLYNYVINSTAPQVFLSMGEAITKSSGGVPDIYHLFNISSIMYQSPLWGGELSSNNQIRSIYGTGIFDMSGGSITLGIDGILENANPTVTSNFTLFNMDLEDDSGNMINNFNVSNVSSDIDTDYSLGAGIHQIMNATYFSQVGELLLISASVTVRSTSGDQAPRFFINSSTVGNPSQCFAQSSTRLANQDEGNLPLIFTCNVSTTNQSHTINAFIEVESGNTVEIIDESMNGFEANPISISLQNVHPVMTLLSPINNASILVNTTQEIQFGSFDLNGDSLNVSIYLYQNGSLFSTLITNMTETNTTFDWFINVPIGDYNLTVEACERSTPDMFCGNTTHVITIFPPLEPLLQIGECSTELPNVMYLIMFFVFLGFMIILAELTKNSVFGVMSGLGMVYLSLHVAACIGIMTIVIASAGLVILKHYAFK